MAVEECLGLRAREPQAFGSKVPDGRAAKCRVPKKWQIPLGV